jgi:tetratricopeptide (TPR) repeat protein
MEFLNQRNMFEELNQFCAQLISKNIDDPYVMLNTGIYLEHIGKNEEAAIHYKKALSQSESDSEENLNTRKVADQNLKRVNAKIFSNQIVFGIGAGILVFITAGVSITLIVLKRKKNISPKNIEASVGQEGSDFE